MRLVALCLPSPRPAELAAFYQRAFDLPAPKAFGDEGHVGMQLGNLYFGFDREESADRGPATVWFQVDDARAMHTRLLELGATTVRAPWEEPGLDEVLVTMRDPDGNMLGVAQKLSP